MPLTIAETSGGGIAARTTRRTSVTVCKVWDADYPWDVRVEKVCTSLLRAHEVHLVSRNTHRRSRYERYGGIHVHRLPAPTWLPRRANAVLGFPAFFNPVCLRPISQ